MHVFFIGKCYFFHREMLCFHREMRVVVEETAKSKDLMLLHGGEGWGVSQGQLGMPRPYFLIVLGKVWGVFPMTKYELGKV